jgi:thimet oligopeptidase
MIGTAMRSSPVIVLTLLAGCASTGDARRVPPTRSIWRLTNTPTNPTAAALDNITFEHLTWVDAYYKQILSVEDPRTTENTLIPYNRMLMHLGAIRFQSDLLSNVHPDRTVREAAEKAGRQGAAKTTELRLDRALYDAFRAVDATGADRATRHFVQRTLRDFRRAGVDKPPRVRAQAARLREEIVQLGQAFQRNIRDDVRSLKLDGAGDLAGLPQDWIAAHSVGKNGKITITTRYPDYVPFMTYAINADARRALYRESKNRGYPQNIDLLNTLIARRNDLAQLLGYANWADYATEDKMIGSAGAAQAFIDRIARVSKAAMERDYAALLERKRRDDPDAAAVADWEKGYYENLVKRERFAFDPRAARPYFNFAQVRDGLFALTGRMFGIEYRQVTGLNLWHPDVTVWDVYEGNKRLGRFYLDLHPRTNKYSHAACFELCAGVTGERLPQAVLVANLPDPARSKDGLALMEHDDVVTIFHEFGHVLHHILGGDRPWVANSGITTEWDFVEAPAQMLEHFCWEVETLQVFARHHETGEPIPADLVARLKRAADFGTGLETAHQLFLAAVSLDYYTQDPKTLDTTELLIELQEKYSPFDYEAGTHLQCSFSHLDNYSAVYYTYLWSLVIAKDLFRQFERDGLLNTTTARRYRATVLDPGGSKKAAELVGDFLGRPFAFDAFEEWLNRQ